MAIAASQRWVPVFSGPVWQALGVQARLEAGGFLTFVPDTNLRTIDPYMTGGDVFALEVLVPEDAVGAAREVVAAETTLTAEQEQYRSEKLHESDAPLRMAWWTIFLPPVGFALGLLYLWRVHATGIKPSGHVFNVVTIAVALLMTIAGVFMLVLPIMR
jgi:hypothetical protein